MDYHSKVDRHKTAASTSGRSLFGRALAGREGGGGESYDDPKGPFGLTTLFEPMVPVTADLVFVHGLGGGSRSTWTKSGDPSLYWPQKWLPLDAAFGDVRVHSFGYNSNWDKESTLNIHDFAKSLLGSIQDCPAIRSDASVGSSLLKVHLKFQCTKARVFFAKVE
jgi:hypothetical protein